MRKLFLTLCLVAVASLAVAAVPQQAEEAEASCSMDGVIMAIDKDHKTLNLKERGEDGETETFAVDEAKVPGWYTSFAVGDVVAATCEQQAESAPVIVGMRKLRERDAE